MKAMNNVLIDLTFPKYLKKLLLARRSASLSFKYKKKKLDKKFARLLIHSYFSMLVVTCPKNKELIWCGLMKNKDCFVYQIFLS